ENSATNASLTWRGLPSTRVLTCVCARASASRNRSGSMAASPARRGSPVAGPVAAIVLSCAVACAAGWRGGHAASTHQCYRGPQRRPQAGRAASAEPRAVGGGVATDAGAALRARGGFLVL